jgi:hypothetical protein
MCEVRSRKNGQEQKKKKKSNKKKSTVISPIRRRMKKRNPSIGQNGQLVHWWLLIHSGPAADALKASPMVIVKWPRHN